MCKNNIWLYALLLFCFSQLVSGKQWDGVVVTQSNYQALKAIRHELVDLRGVLRSWNDTGFGACSGGWVGIKCVNGQVIAIQLPYKGLGGIISEKIGQLQSLRKISLHDNVIGGPIPASLGLLPNLRGVHLFNNQLTGSIPSSVGNCLLLQNLDISNNQLTGNLQLCDYSASTSCPSPSPSIVPSPSPMGLKHHRHHRLNTKGIIFIAAGALLLVLLLLCCGLLCCLISKKTASKAKNSKAARPATTSGAAAKSAVPAVAIEVESGGGAGGKLVHFDGPFVFTADDLLSATAEIMGKSAYGTAYMATLEDDNQVVVKRLREKITRSHKEFETEVAELGRIRHPNILALRAYYLGPKGEKLLVYDYMPNGSLASFLHARGPETGIAWLTRMNIAIGITQGLCYLHTQENIVHGNLASSNIMLDEHNSPKIADVGLSKLMTSAANTNVTVGYRAPEFSKLKNASTKTDVFSLGVIMLELLTGKSASDATDGLDLPQWVSSIVKEEWTNEVFDVELIRDTSNIGDELLNTLKLALHCVDPSPTARPGAAQVLQKLEEIKPEAPGTSADDPSPTARPGAAQVLQKLEEIKPEAPGTSADDGAQE